MLPLCTVTGMQCSGSPLSFFFESKWRRTLNHGGRGSTKLYIRCTINTEKEVLSAKTALEPFVIQRSALLFQGWQSNFQKWLQNFEVAASKYNLGRHLTSMASKTAQANILKIASNQCKSSKYWWEVWISERGCKKPNFLSSEELGARLKSLLVWKADDCLMMTVWWWLSVWWVSTLMTNWCYAEDF